MVLCGKVAHARLRKQTCTPDHCVHGPVLQGDPGCHRVMCDMSSLPHSAARSLAALGPGLPIGPSQLIELGVAKLVEAPVRPEIGDQVLSSKF